MLLHVGGLPCQISQNNFYIFLNLRCALKPWLICLLIKQQLWVLQENCFFAVFPKVPGLICRTVHCTQIESWIFVAKVLEFCYPKIFLWRNLFQIQRKLYTRIIWWMYSNNWNILFWRDCGLTSSKRKYTFWKPRGRNYRVWRALRKSRISWFLWFS